MTATSLIKVPMGEWEISFDIGIEDEYKIIDLGTSELEKEYGASKVKIPSRIYKAVVVNPKKIIAYISDLKDGTNIYALTNKFFIKISWMKLL